jgi:hypothetical protein
MSRFLPYLPALACPLLMLVCMAAMRRMHSPPAQARPEPPAGTEQRIAQLEQEQAAVRAQRHHPAEPTAPAQAAPGGGNGTARRAATGARRPGIVTLPAAQGR